MLFGAGAGFALHYDSKSKGLTVIVLRQLPPSTQVDAAIACSTDSSEAELAGEKVGQAGEDVVLVCRAEGDG